MDSFSQESIEAKCGERLLKRVSFHVIFGSAKNVCNLNLGVFRKGGTARGRSLDTQSVLDVVFFCWLPWPSTSSKILQHLDGSYHIHNYNHTSDSQKLN